MVETYIQFSNMSNFGLVKNKIFIRFIFVDLDKSGYVNVHVYLYKAADIFVNILYRYTYIIFYRIYIKIAISEYNIK